MAPKDLFMVVLGLAHVVAGWFVFREVWRCWRTHRRFQAATRDCDLALAMMERARTREELERRAMRVGECLETMDAIRKE
jgi:hypothetical protein